MDAGLVLSVEQIESSRKPGKIECMICMKPSHPRMFPSLNPQQVVQQGHRDSDDSNISTTTVRNSGPGPGTFDVVMTHAFSVFQHVSNWSPMNSRDHSPQCLGHLRSHFPISSKSSTYSQITSTRYSCHLRTSRFRSPRLLQRANL